MHFDLLTYINCLIEGVILLMLWRIADPHPFKILNYLLSYILLCGISIPVTFVDSVFFSILPINFLLIALCMWIGFRWYVKEAFLHSLFQFLLLLYIQCIVNTFVPEFLFMTNAGNFIANGCTFTVALILLLLSHRYRFSRLLQQHASTVWAFFLILCLPEILIVQTFVSYKESPSTPVGIIMLLLQTLYTIVVVFGFFLMRRRTERRQLADTQKYIDDMNSQLEESRRSVHDFNKHIRYLRNIVATDSNDEQLIRRVGDYCETMLDSYEKEETLLQLDDPVLRALLYGRQTEASRNGVEFLLEATPVLPVFPLKTHQIVEVFDNLIDNAFECVEGLPEEARWVRIRLSVESAGEGRVCHRFSVENPAPSVDMTAVISTKAYTSKGGRHRGIGLRHVGQLVSATGGRLILSHQNGVFGATLMYE